MNQSKNKNKNLTCDCCDTKVPLSAALTPEGMDYVLHFCGTRGILTLAAKTQVF